MSGKRKNSSSGRPETAGAVLRGVLGKLGINKALSRHRILHLWPEIVEPTVARHAKAERITGSTLHVVVDSSVWMYELALIKNVLLEKVNGSLDQGAARISDIRFSQRSWSNPISRKEAEPKAKLEEDDLRKIKQILTPIEDAELRILLKRILEKDALMKKGRKDKK